MKQMRYHLLIMLSSLFWLNQAANDIPSDAHITLQGVDGTRREIQRDAIEHSRVLSRVLSNNSTLLSLSCDDCTNFNELGMLTHLLGVMHCAQAEQWDTPAVEKRLEDCYRHNPVTVAGIASCYDMPLLKEVIVKANEKVVQGHSIYGDSEKKVATTYATVCLWREKLNSCKQEDLRPLTQQGVAFILENINERERVAKRRYKESKGTIREPFFTGVSLGDLIELSLVDPQYDRHPAIGHLLDGPSISKAHLKDIVSIEGFACHKERCAASQRPCKRVHLCDTSIRELPAGSFKHAENPTWIQLDHNDIAVIDPKAFDGQSALTSLWISYNALRSLPLGVFDALKNLQVLTLDHNQLTVFDTRLLEHTAQLLLLCLSYNQLSQVPSPWPLACQNLQDLNLKNNNIKALSCEQLYRLPSLKRILLESNSITEINAEVFRDCTQLKSIHLTNNPIPIEQIHALREALPRIRIDFGE